MLLFYALLARYGGGGYLAESIIIYRKETYYIVSNRFKCLLVCLSVCLSGGCISLTVIDRKLKFSQIVKNDKCQNKRHTKLKKKIFSFINNNMEVPSLCNILVLSSATGNTYI